MKESPTNKLVVEENGEALNKIVDIRATPDLKYKKIPLGFLSRTLAEGIRTPASQAMVDAALRNGTQGALRERAATRDVLRTREVERETALSDDYEMKGNVYYPEGILLALRDEITGKKRAELYYKKQTDINNPGTTEKILRTAYKHLLYVTARDAALGGFKTRFRLDKQGDPVSCPENDEIVKEMLSDENFEPVRQAWLREFWRSGSVWFNTGGWGGDDFEMMQATMYKIGFGLVLSPNIPVFISSHPDFPTEAIIRPSRIPPRDVIGIVVSGVDERHVSHLKDGTFFKSTLPNKTSSYYFDRHGQRRRSGEMESNKTNTLNFLQSTFFKIPQDEFFSVLQSGYGDYLVRYCREKGRGNLSDEVIRLMPEIIKATRSWRGHEDERTTTSLGDHVRRAVSGVTENQLIVDLDKVSREFIEEMLPFKDGESLWEGLKKMAKKKQIPIYDTDGNVLWPART